jgi:hypothetical protein
VDGDPVLPARRALGRGNNYSKNAKPINVVAQQLTITTHALARNQGCLLAFNNEYLYYYCTTT